jgi:hypothetical protein
VLSRSWGLQRLMRNAEVSLGERTIKLKVQRKDGATGKVEVGEIEVSAHDAKAANQALIALGRTDECRLFLDRVEATGRDGAPLLPEASSRDVARAVLDILRQARLGDAPERARDPDDEPEEQEIEELAPSGSPTAAAEGLVSSPAAAPSPVESPQRRPSTLQPGEREVFDNGAEIVRSAEFERYEVLDGAGVLHGYRRDLAAARALAAKLKPPPKENP